MHWQDLYLYSIGSPLL